MDEFSTESNPFLTASPTGIDGGRTDALIKLLDPTQTNSKKKSIKKTNS